jgi:nitrate reductase / nitrite oxidoreductase, alpha subunit
VTDGPTKGMAKIDTAIDACEVVLMLAPETNGEVAVKAWEALGKATGREHAHLAEVKEDEKIRFRDIAAQPRKIISSPTWSGIESEEVCYNAGWTNVHELIPGARCRAASSSTRTTNGCWPSASSSSPGARRWT